MGGGYFFFKLLLSFFLLLTRFFFARMSIPHPRDFLAAPFYCPNRTELDKRCFMCNPIGSSQDNYALILLNPSTTLLDPDRSRVGGGTWGPPPLIIKNREKWNKTNKTKKIQKKRKEKLEKQLNDLNICLNLMCIHIFITYINKELSNPPPPPTPPPLKIFKI